jgi:putative sterol carrier protein
MNTLKLEGSKYDIKVNAVAPVAATRLTEDVLPPELYAKMKPEYVAPLVMVLCSEACPATGLIVNAGLGCYCRSAIVAAKGTVLGDGATIPSPEDIKAHWATIHDLAGAEPMADTNAFFGTLMERFQPQGQGAPGAVLQAPAKGSGLTVAAVFEKMPAAFQKGAAAGVNVVFQYKISGEGGGEWYTEIKDQACQVKAGVHPKPTTTILMAAADFLDLMQGKLNAMKAFTSKKLKIEGDLMKSQLIEKLFKLG